MVPQMRSITKIRGMQISFLSNVWAFAAVLFVRSVLL